MVFLPGCSQDVFCVQHASVAISCCNRASWFKTIHNSHYTTFGSFEIDLIVEQTRFHKRSPFLVISPD